MQVSAFYSQVVAPPIKRQTLIGGIFLPERARSFKKVSRTVDVGVNVDVVLASDKYLFKKKSHISI